MKREKKVVAAYEFPVIRIANKKKIVRAPTQNTSWVRVSGALAIAKYSDAAAIAHSLPDTHAHTHFVQQII